MAYARLLTANDANDLKEIRLQALQNEGYVFIANLAEEEGLSLSQWRNVATETTGRAMFGLFSGTELIGIAGAELWDNDQSRNNVYWRATYVKPAYRGQGLADKLYNLSKEWSIARGCTEAVFAIRPDNKRSIAIRTKQGAKLIGSKRLHFADGQYAEALWFHLPLLS